MGGHPGFERCFEDMEVFRRAYGLSLEVHRASLTFPKVEQYALADQVRRSSKSVCATFAEGFGKQRQSKAEFRRYLLMALGSADEMQVWSRYCVDLGYTDAIAGERWCAEYREIARMLQSLINRLDRSELAPSSL
jgi:four helix bundle protein